MLGGGLWRSRNFRVIERFPFGADFVLSKETLKHNLQTFQSRCHFMHQLCTSRHLDFLDVSCAVVCCTCDSVIHEDVS